MTTIETLPGRTIMTKDYENCYLCGKQATEAHHILHGADKKLSEQYGLMVPLCRECHYQIHHGSGENDRKLKEDAQRVFLIKIFGRCYL